MTARSLLRSHAFQTENKLSPLLPDDIVRLEQRFTTTPLQRIDPKDVAMGSKLGEGGMSVVVQGTYNGKDVAAKIIKSVFLGENTDFENRLFRSLNRCKTIYGLPGFALPLGYSIDSQLVLLFEKYDMNLAQYSAHLHNVVDDPTTRTQLLLRAISAAATQLERLHQKGILHRDVKPENILLNIDDATHVARNVTLSDFDLAGNDIEHGGSQTVTQNQTANGCLFGTLSYLHPAVQMNPLLLRNGSKFLLDYYAISRILERFFYNIDPTTFKKQESVDNTDKQADTNRHTTAEHAWHWTEQGLDIEQIIRKRRAFRESDHLEDIARHLGVSGLERVVIRAGYATEEESHLNYPALANTDGVVTQHALVDDITAILDSDNKAVQTNKANTTAWLYRKGPEAAKKELYKKTLRKRLLVGVAAAGLLFSAAATHDYFARNNSAAYILERLEKEDRLPTPQEARELQLRLAREYKERFVWADIAKDSDNETNVFYVLNRTRTKKENAEQYRFDTDSLYAKEHLSDIGVVAVISKDPFFIEQYKKFCARLVCIEKDYQQPMTGRFLALTNIPELMQEKNIREKLLQAHAIIRKSRYTQDDNRLNNTTMFCESALLTITPRWYDWRDHMRTGTHNELETFGFTNNHASQFASELLAAPLRITNNIAHHRRNKIEQKELLWQQTLFLYAAAEIYSTTIPVLQKTATKDSALWTLTEQIEKEQEPHLQKYTEEQWSQLQILANNTISWLKEYTTHLQGGLPPVTIEVKERDAHAASIVAVALQKILMTTKTTKLYSTEQQAFMKKILQDTIKNMLRIQEYTPRPHQFTSLFSTPCTPTQRHATKEFNFWIHGGIRPDYVGSTSGTVGNVLTALEEYTKK